MTVIKLDDVKGTVIGAFMGYYKPESKEFSELKNRLEKHSHPDVVREIKPFYKDDDLKNPAGYVISTDAKVMICLLYTSPSPRDS